MIHVRSLPRVFVPGADPDAPVIELPKDEVDKLRKVLRLGAGDTVAVLPDDGTIVVCEFTGREARPISRHLPDVESPVRLTIAQALPKGDKLDEIVRACTELGASRFVLFASERTVVRWDQAKLQDRIRRLHVIAREACEVSFRTRLPEFAYCADLAAVLKDFPDSQVLSESELAFKVLVRTTGSATVVVGPEGGWAPRELELIGDRGVTLGPRVLRVEHAAASAAAIMLIPH